MKKIILPIIITLFLTIFSGCTTSEIKIPSNLDVKNNTLTWTLQNDVKYYEVEMTILDETTYHQVENNFNFSSYLNSSIETISFRVKGLKQGTTYSNDSNYSNVYTYNNTDYKETYAKEIITQSFLNQKTAPKGWIYNYNASIYADGSLKFSNNNESITSVSFEPCSTFKVEVTILGKNAGGDSIITIYGLDDNNNILEQYQIDGPILNTKNTISAIFSNTNITKVKFEYSKKALGNFGLFEIKIFHLSNDEIISIEALDLTTNYTIGDDFDYKGNLKITYSDNTSKIISLTAIKDELIISNFNNKQFYKGELQITYKDITISSPYTMSYNYPSLNHSYPYTDVIVKKDLIYIKLDNIDVLIILSDDDLDNFNQLIKDNDIEYLISYHNIESLKVKKFIKLDEVNTQTYHLSPTATLIYTPNGILLNNYNTQILIDTTGDISDEIKISSYDYIITNSSNYLAKTKNLIINRIATMNDYHNINQIYMKDSSISIYDLSYQNEILWQIDKYSSNFTTSVTEISSLDTWNYEYKHLDNLYPYSHEDYYESIIGLTGDALRNQLSSLITSTHSNIVDYDFARNAYLLTDPDFDHPGNIILFYSGQSINGTWENGITWNREHIWPKSLSGGLYSTVNGSSKNAGTDLHQLRPALTSINSSRNNKPFGPITNNLYFEPKDDIKGDVARIIFYMNIRYNMDIEKLGVAKSIEMLILWHNQDPVDYYETYRNEQIQKIQGNYNPFIDNPWLVDLIY